MKGLSYSISIPVSAQMEMAGIINAKIMPMVSQAVQAIAQVTSERWQEEVLAARGIWSVEKDAYAQSISWKTTGDFSAVVEATYKYASEIETGRPPKDLKRMLDTSSKVRRTIKGKRFLVIPMRKNTPGNTAHAQAMPAAVHDLASNLAASKILGQGQRPSGEVTVLSPKTGMHAAPVQTPYLSNPKTRQASMVNANKYAWGGRITAGMLKAAGLPKEDVKRYAGMVRMSTSTPGGGKSSSYLTFRVMMEGSSGWIVPAKPGLYIAKKVAEEMQPKAVKAIGAAVKATMTG